MTKGTKRQDRRNATQRRTSRLAREWQRVVEAEGDSIRARRIARAYRASR